MTTKYKQMARPTAEQARLSATHVAIPGYFQGSSGYVEGHQGRVAYEDLILQNL